LIQETGNQTIRVACAGAFEAKTPDALRAYGRREVAITKRRPGKCAHEVKLILQLEPQMLMNKQEIPAARNTAFFEQISSK
jgi:hypothetical protein